jgi:PEGA domain
VIAVVPYAARADARDAGVAEPDAEAPPLDAPPDARARRPASDAGARPPIDAPSPPGAARADAAVAVAVTGTGKLVVRHHPDSPSYLEVRIDGVTFGRTPIVVAKPINAGPHVLTLVRPNTSEVVYRKDIVVVDGETLSIQQPTP